MLDDLEFSDRPAEQRVMLAKLNRLFPGSLRRAAFSGACMAAPRPSQCFEKIPRRTVSGLSQVALSEASHSSTTVALPRVRVDSHLDGKYSTGSSVSTLETETIGLLLV